MIYKAILLLCTLGVAMAQNTYTNNVPANTYAYRLSFVKGSGCPADGQFMSEFYPVGMCSYYQYINIDTTKTDSIGVSGSSTRECNDGTLGGTNTFIPGQCITGDNTDYSWNYATSLNSSILSSTLPTYTYYSPRTTRCSGEILYLKQTYPVCYDHIDAGYNFSMITCGANKVQTTKNCLDGMCSAGCRSSTATLNNACTNDGDQTVVSCGAPITLTVVGGSSQTTAAVTENTNAGSTVKPIAPGTPGSTPGGDGNTPAGPTTTSTNNGDSNTSNAVALTSSLSVFFIASVVALVF